MLKRGQKIVQLLSFPTVLKLLLNFLDYIDFVKDTNECCAGRSNDTNYGSEN